MSRKDLRKHKEEGAECFIQPNCEEGNHAKSNRGSALVPVSPSSDFCSLTSTSELFVLGKPPRFMDSLFGLAAPCIGTMNLKRVSPSESRRAFSGSWKAPTAFCACIRTMNPVWVGASVRCPAFSRPGPAKAGTPNGRFVERIKGTSPKLKTRLAQTEET